MSELLTGLLVVSTFDVILFGLSMLVAELYTRTKIRAVLTFQVGLLATKKNLSILTGRLKENHSRSLIYIGEKLLNLHHWKVGLFLAGVSTLLANIHMLSVSLGLITHHILQNKIYPKISKFLS